MDSTLFMTTDSRYERTADGGYRLKARVNPSHYASDSTPESSPTDNLRRAGRAADLDLAESAAIMRAESKARGEGHAREQREYRLSPTFCVPTVEIHDAQEYRAWLAIMATRPSTLSSEHALAIVCYKSAYADMQELRVHWTREAWHSFAEEAGAIAAFNMLNAESTLRVRGEHKGLTLLAASLADGNGAFPVMRMVGFECKNAVQTCLKREEGMRQALAEEFVTAQDYATIDSEEEHDVNGWIRLLAKQADEEEAREGESGKVTLRRDMWQLYWVSRYGRQLESSRGKEGSTQGMVHRDRVADSLGWSRAKYARTKMELAVSHAKWFKSEAEARATEEKLREDYRKGFIGDKKQQAQNKIARQMVAA